ncbi:MAG TPA: YkgJ family cysteine cluster protein [Gammaproteobacteria bacterium]
MKVSRERINAAATAAFRDTTETLGRGCNAASCAALCQRHNTVIEAEMETLERGGAAVACRSGCDFCCHQRVSVLPHEAFALLNHLRTRATAAEAAVIEQRIRDNALKIDGMTLSEHYAANLACAFLIDGRCAAYAARPSVCASFHSLSRERCEYSFNHPKEIGTPRNSRPALLQLTAFTDALIEATQAGTAVAGFPNGKEELHQAVRALLDTPAYAED